jgi:hypothetical protein
MVHKSWNAILYKIVDIGSMPQLVFSIAWFYTAQEGS